MQAADRRRFNGPEGARPPHFNKTASLNQAHDAASTWRPDGRTPSQIRPLCEPTSPGAPNLFQNSGLKIGFTVMQTGLVSDASGSVYIETGRTKVICAVHGPKPTAPSVAFSPRARLSVEVKFAPFSSGVRRFAPGKVRTELVNAEQIILSTRANINNPLSLAQDTESLTLSSAVHQAILPSLLLETLPKSQIDLFLTILESDGNDDDIAAQVFNKTSPRSGITAASVALAKAGIPMRGLVVATSAALLSRCPTQAFFDPALAEARNSIAFATIACLPALGTITSLTTTGSFPMIVLEETLETAVKICGQLHGVAKQALLDDSNEEI
ncbi:BZ3500_MvSof-1268-A1-R1_Chr9g10782 [Microbotryum saponariae]|uniref:BZ3500_MvSof-1268-A1-R1_Chr9g10782 protein n=1 Tax=Microbotryum saponariae TaxID=289078 RepID=A0A2X0KFC8_9BASI|nr:BZ3501_MvSof-1269-A2-R1_Chr9g10530 [Microbotryum saponariae]SDA00680.1 BZ3500_MvSof-1268-A1-R1_Chr9g10782 [Microbotryum saponariae]